MPVGVLRSERSQLRQIIACERAALEADRFHWPEVLRQPAPRVQPEMSKLQREPVAPKSAILILPELTHLGGRQRRLNVKIVRFSLFITFVK
jgi:hypothetical protein